MDTIFQAALIDLYKSGIAGNVYILRRPDGSYFHSVEWSYLPYPHTTLEGLFAEKYPGCEIAYVGGIPSQHGGNGVHGFMGYVNDWTKKPRYRLQDTSYRFEYEEALPQPPDAAGSPNE